MLNLILSIIFISVLGIVAFFIFFNYLLQRTFHIEHVESKISPEKFGFDAHEHFISVEHHKRIQVIDLNPTKIAPIRPGNLIRLKNSVTIDETTISRPTSYKTKIALLCSIFNG